MTTKILAVAILFAVAFVGCDGMELMMPPDSEVVTTEVVATTDSEWHHLCEGHKERLEREGAFGSNVPENLSDWIDIGGFGTTWEVNGVSYSFSRSSGVDSVPEDYKIGNWIPGVYFNTPVESDVPIDFIYLCVDSNLVDTGGKYLFKADERGFVEFAFRLPPEILSIRDAIESPIGVAIVFKDGTVTYDTPVYLYKISADAPKSWAEVDW